jgi:hypothetical protein
MIYPLFSNKKVGFLKGVVDGESAPIGGQDLSTDHRSRKFGEGF